MGLKVSAFAIEKVALDRRSACALKMHQQAILRRRKLSHATRELCVAPTGAQAMSRCLRKTARTANKQMPNTGRTDWKYGRFPDVVRPAVIVHNGMALA
jgi:hypothetical protein